MHETADSSRRSQLRRRKCGQIALLAFFIPLCGTLSAAVAKSPFPTADRAFAKKDWIAARKGYTQFLKNAKSWIADCAKQTQGEIESQQQ